MNKILVFYEDTGISQVDVYDVAYRISPPDHISRGKLEYMSGVIYDEGEFFIKFIDRRISCLSTLKTHT